MTYKIKTDDRVIIVNINGPLKSACGVVVGHSHSWAEYRSLIVMLDTPIQYDGEIQRAISITEHCLNKL